ncbi:MAG: hypothetical protein AAF696_17130 [Bacteroidota bacterium]
MSDFTSHIDTEATDLDLMERYLAGTLSEDEQKQMKEQLSKDPVLADALEGLALIEDKEAMKAAIGRIQTVSRKKLNKFEKKREQLSKRRARVGESNLKFSNYYVAAAAAILVLVSTVVVIRMSESNKSSAPTNTTYADRMSPQAEAEINDQTNDNAGPEALFQALADDDSVEMDNSSAPNIREEEPIVGNSANNARARSLAKKEQKPVSSSDENSKAASLLAETGEKSEEIASAELRETVEADDDFATEDAEVLEEKSIVGAQESAPVKPSLASPLNDTAPPVLSEEELSKIPLEAESSANGPDYNSNDRYVDKEAKPKRSQKKRLDDNIAYKEERSEEDKVFGKISKGQHLADLMLDAVKYYEAAEFDKSLNLLKEVMQNEPKHPAANFYAGSIYRNYSQMKTATNFLKEATQHADAPTYEYAQWELALVYIARKKELAAKKLLTKIATGGGKFSNQARSELEKLSEQ